MVNNTGIEMLARILAGAVKSHAAKMAEARAWAEGYRAAHDMGLDPTSNAAAAVRAWREL